MTVHVDRRLRRALEGIEQPAILLSRDYRILDANDAYREHYGKVPRFGEDHCFSISHGYDSPCDRNGEACPLAKSLKTGEAARVFHVHAHPEGPEHVDVELRPINDEDGELLAFVEVIAPFEQASARALGTFVGRSAPFTEMLELLNRGAPSEVPILLLGESGTGKELAARAVHEASERRGGPFVPVECTGLSEHLFESELFGHARGAFTGAHERKSGLVDACRGGTLFLDEIGDVPLSQQVKLLRLLESGTYRPVGDAQEREADFRLVCATHRDLEGMVDAGEFRRDLYYRVSAFPIPMPPLRERASDIPLLAEALLRGIGKKLAPEALAALQAYSFPGNIRELRNFLDRAVLLTDGQTIGVEQLPPKLRGASAPAPRGPWPWGDAILPVDEVERRYLQWASAAHGGDRRELADELGLSERTLYRRLRTHRDDPAD